MAASIICVNVAGMELNDVNQIAQSTKNGSRVWLPVAFSSSQAHRDRCSSILSLHVQDLKASHFRERWSSVWEIDDLSLDLALALHTVTARLFVKVISSCNLDRPKLSVKSNQEVIIFTVVSSFLNRNADPANHFLISLVKAAPCRLLSCSEMARTKGTRIPYSTFECYNRIQAEVAGGRDWGRLHDLVKRGVGRVDYLLA